MTDTPPAIPVLTREDLANDIAAGDPATMLALVFALKAEGERADAAEAALATARREALEEAAKVSDVRAAKSAKQRKENGSHQTSANEFCRHAESTASGIGKDIRALIDKPASPLDAQAVRNA